LSATSQKQKKKRKRQEPSSEPSLIPINQFISQACKWSVLIFFCFMYLYVKKLFPLPYCNIMFLILFCKWCLYTKKGKETLTSITSRNILSVSFKVGHNFVYFCLCLQFIHMQQRCQKTISKHHHFQVC